MSSLSGVAPTAETIKSDRTLVRRAVLLAGVLASLQIADPVVTSLALPKAGQSLNMTASTLALAASISTLCLAATVMLMGALADRIGRRRLMSIATIGFIAGDLIVVLSPQTAVFMLGRAIAGICVGGVLATAYAYVRTVSPPGKLGANLGLFGATQASLAIPICVIAAGLASINWRLAFLCTPVVAAICLALEAKLFPLVVPHLLKKQLYGLSIAGLGIAAGLYGISQSGTNILSPSVAAPILIGLGLVAVAVILGFKSARPAYPIRIFRSPVFVAAAVSGALWNLSLSVAQFQSSNLWQYAHELEPFTVSILQLPFTLAFVGGAFLVGRLLTNGKKPRDIIAVGLLVVAVGFVLMSLTGASPVAIAFVVALMVAGFGAGATNIAQSQILITEAPDEFVGSVAASRTTFGQIGYTLGLAGGSVVTTLMTLRAIGTPDARQQLDQFLAADKQEIANNPALGDLVEQIAPLYTDAFRTGMWMWAAFIVVGAIICYALMSMRPHPLASAQTEAVEGTSAT